MIDDAVIDQPGTESITDRIASKFGFPGTGQEQAEPATAQAVESDLAELEWEGAKYQVPTKLKDAFMRNDDYTRKTQELAEQRKSLDHVRELSQQRALDSAFGESIAAEQQQISVIDAYLSQASKLDWSQMSTDQMLRHKVEIDNIKEQRALLKGAIDGKRDDFTKQVNARIVEMRGKSRELASKSIQGFSEQTESEMRKFAIAEGLAEPEVDNVLLDPRSYKIIWKAMQFDKVQSGTSRVDTATKVLKPGAAGERMPAKTAANLNFNKAMKSATNSSQKARVIEERLSGIFAKGHT